MLRILCLLLLTSCTLGSSQFGGKRPYQYDPQTEYTSQDLSNMAQEVVIAYKRDPRQLSWGKAFSKKHPITRTSTLSFETIIQPTRAGITGFDKVYLSPKGKQLLTEKLLSVWEEVYSTINADELSYLPMRKFFDDKTLHSQYGLEVKDHGASQQSGLAADDIFVLEKGRGISALSLFGPHFARDLSLLLVPAHQLFGGSRGNEFQKYYIAEASESYKLDALYSVLVEIDWQSTRVDKLTKKSIHQKAVIKMKLTPILSYKQLAKRLKEEGKKLPDDLPNLNFANYEISVDIPVDLNSISKESSVDEIDALILRPVLKSYADMCVMISHRLNQDFKSMKIE